MANDPKNILIGAGVVSVGAYVASGAAGALVDIGAIIGGTQLTDDRDYHESFSDHHMGPLKVSKTKDMTTIVLTMEEMDADRLIIALDQPASVVSGSAPNKTIKHDPNAAVQLKQVQIVGTGPEGATGVSAVRTITGWKGYAKKSGSQEFKKESEQKVQVTIGLLQDLTAAAVGADWRLVDAGGA